MSLSLNFLATVYYFLPAHNSKPCLLFRVDLGTTAKCLDSAPFPLLLPQSVFLLSDSHFSLTVSIKISLKYLKFWAFSSLYVFCLWILDQRRCSGCGPTATGSVLLCGIWASLCAMWSQSLLDETAARGFTQGRKLRYVNMARLK